MSDSDISATSEPQQEPSRAPKRRRRRRWPYIVVLLVLLLGVLGYALLPWLIPTTWLRNQLVAGIQEELGREASIASIEISWDDGIIVRELAINRLQRFGPGHFFKASRIQLDFQPLRLLLKEQLGNLRIDGAQLWIVTDAKGSNLISLPTQEQGNGPTFDQITLANTKLHFVDQIRARQSLLPIANISVACDADTGQYSFLAETATSKTPGSAFFSLRGDFAPAQKQGLRLGQTDATGSAELTWSELDLASLPLPGQPKLDLAIVSGKTSGQARLRLGSDKLELLSCTAAVDNLELHLAKISKQPQSEPPQPEKVRIPRANFELQGSYEFTSEELTVEKLNGMMTGLEFESSLKGRFLRAEGTLLPIDVSLTTTVQPSRLREQFSFVEELLAKHDLTITGSTILTMDFKQSGETDELIFSINATQAGLHAPGLLHKSAGLPCKLTVPVLIDQNAGTLALKEPLELELGSGRLTLDVQLAQPLSTASLVKLLARPEEAAQLVQPQWRQTRISSSFEIEDVSELAPIFPAFADILANDKFTLTGPIHATLNLSPLPTDGPDSPIKLTAAVSFAAKSSFQWAPYFSKPVGKPLRFSLAANLAADNSRLDKVQVSCELGQALMSIANASCAVKFLPSSVHILPPSSSAANWYDNIDSLSTACEFRMENYATFAQAIPALQQLDMDGDLTGQFSLDLQPRGSLRLGLTLDATDLALRVPASLADAAEENSPRALLFQKSLHTPAKLDLQFQANLPTNNQGEPTSWLELNVDNASVPTFHGKLSWQLGNDLALFEIEHRSGPPPKTSADSESQAKIRDGFNVDLSLSKIDLDRLDENFPLLSSICEQYQLAGSASLKLGARLSPELLLEAVEFSADFTSAQCIIPAKTAQANDSDQTSPRFILSKSAQQPFTVQGSLRVGDYDEQGYRRVELKSASVNFAGSQLNFEGSSVLARLDKKDSKERIPLSAMERLLGNDRFVSAQLDADGQVVLNKELFALFSELEDIDRRVDLSGVLNYALEFSADRTQAVFTAKLNAGPEGLKLGQLAFDKAEHRLQLFFNPETEELALSRASLELAELELSLFETPVRLSAKATLNEDRLDVSDLFMAAGDSSTHLTARLENIRTAPSGYIQIDSSFIDQPMLTDLATKVVSFIKEQVIAGQSPTTKPKPEPLPEESSADLQALEESSADSQAVNVLKLPPMDINLGLSCDKLILIFPGGTVKFNLEQVRLNSQLTPSSLTTQFRSALNGGRLEGDLSVLFDTPGVPLTYSYESLDLIVDENIAPLVSNVFPNMTVHGTLSETRSFTLHLISSKEYPKLVQDHGRTTMHDGVLVGPAAPSWVTRLFPSLLLSEYYFEVADNVFSKDPKTGRTTNDTVFIGKDTYNIYLTGITMPDNTTDYDMGIDFSSSVSLEERHKETWPRFVLLTFTGQIIDGKWAHQEVSFTWPRRVSKALKGLITGWRKDE